MLIFCPGEKQIYRPSLTYDMERIPNNNTVDVDGFIICEGKQYANRDLVRSLDELIDRDDGCIIQRPIDLMRVSDMVKDQLEEYNSSGTYSFVMPIVLSSLNGVVTVLDGQHRIKTVKKLYSKYDQRDVIVNIIIRYFDRREDKNREYIRINSVLENATIAHDGQLYDNRGSLQVLLNLIQGTFGKQYQSNNRSNDPYFSSFQLQKEVQDYQILNRMNPHEYFNLLCNVNQLHGDYLRKEYNRKYQDLTMAGGFYLVFYGPSQNHYASCRWVRIVESYLIKRGRGGKPYPTKPSNLAPTLPLVTRVKPPLVKPPRIMPVIRRQPENLINLDDI